MSESFDHYLMTRFNLRNPDWEFTKRNEALLTDEWMEDRMWFFENFCFPSVAGQSNKDFTWLIFFDITTPEKYRKQAAQLAAGHPNIELHYIDGMPAFYPSIKEIVTERSASKPYLITSRIDNDDAIHKDFIAEVQKKFNKQDYRAIDIVTGYSLQIKPSVMLGKKEHIFNPFISLIEKNDDPKTVWANDHHLWKKETRVTQVFHKRLWIAVIHEKNKVNNFNGYDNVKWEDLMADFVLSDEANQFVIANQIPMSKWWKLSLKNKWIVKYKVFGKWLKKLFGVYKIK